MKEYQTRSEETGLIQHDSLEKAMNHALADDTVWKVSYTNEAGARIRIERGDNCWIEMVANGLQWDETGRMAFWIKSLVLPFKRYNELEEAIFNMRKNWKKILGGTATTDAQIDRDILKILGT